MKKNRIKAAILLSFLCGIIGLTTYFVNATQIEGSTPETGATSSEENKDAKVTTSSVAPGSEDVDESPTEVKQSVAPEATPVEPQPETEIYTVQEGQNLWEIAQTTEMSMQDLMNSNQLSSSAIFAGQELLVEK